MQIRPVSASRVRRRFCKARHSNSGSQGAKDQIYPKVADAYRILKQAKFLFCLSDSWPLRQKVFRPSHKRRSADRSHASKLRYFECSILRVRTLLHTLLFNY